MSADKKPMQSKKFAAFLISNVGWMVFLFYFVSTHEKSMDHYVFMVLMTSIITNGFLQLGYVLGQAAVDKYAMTMQKALGSETQPGASEKKTQGSSDV